MSTDFSGLCQPLPTPSLDECSIDLGGIMKEDTNSMKLLKDERVIIAAKDHLNVSTRELNDSSMFIYVTSRDRSVQSKELEDDAAVYKDKVIEEHVCTSVNKEEDSFTKPQELEDYAAVYKDKVIEEHVCTSVNKEEDSFTKPQELEDDAAVYKDKVIEEHVCTSVNKEEDSFTKPQNGIVFGNMKGWKSLKWWIVFGNMICWKTLMWIFFFVCFSVLITAGQPSPIDRVRLKRQAGKAPIVHYFPWGTNQTLECPSEVVIKWQCNNTTSHFTRNASREGRTHTVLVEHNMTCTCFHDANREFNEQDFIVVAVNTLQNCGALTNIINGAVSTPQGTLEGANATYICSTGYGLSGGATRICVNGTWSGTPPTCLKDNFVNQSMNNSSFHQVVNMKITITLSVLGFIAVVVGFVYYKRKYIIQKSHTCCYGNESAEKITYYNKKNEQCSMMDHSDATPGSSLDSMLDQQECQIVLTSGALDPNLALETRNETNLV